MLANWRLVDGRCADRGMGDPFAMPVRRLLNLAYVWLTDQPAWTQKQANVQGELRVELDWPELEELAAEAESTDRLRGLARMLGRHIPELERG